MRIIKIAQSYNELVEWVKSQGKDIRQIVKEVMQSPPDGKGSNADFWKIPNSSFGIRVTRYHFSKINDSNEPEESIDSFPEGNFGQKVMSIGPIEIVKLQSGNPAGKPYRSMKGDESDRSVFLFRLKEAAEMPLEFYMKLMNEIKVINGKGYKVDPSKAGNLLIDSSRGFGLVDLNHNNSSYTNSADDIIIMLIDNFNFNMNFGEKTDTESNQARLYAQEIIKKVELSSKSVGFEFRNGSGVQYSYELSKGPTVNVDNSSDIKSSFLMEPW